VLLYTRHHSRNGFPLDSEMAYVPAGNVQRICGPASTLMSNLLPPSRIRRANHLHLSGKNSAGRAQQLRTRTRHRGTLFGVRSDHILERLALELRAEEGLTA
jgi:hypothetical protein